MADTPANIRKLQQSLEKATEHLTKHKKTNQNSRKKSGQAAFNKKTKELEDEIDRIKKLLGNAWLQHHRQSSPLSPAPSGEEPVATEIVHNKKLPVDVDGVADHSGSENGVGGEFEDGLVQALNHSQSPPLSPAPSTNSKRLNDGDDTNASDGQSIARLCRDEADGATVHHRQWPRYLPYRSK